MLVVRPSNVVQLVSGILPRLLQIEWYTVRSATPTPAASADRSGDLYLRSSASFFFVATIVRPSYLHLSLCTAGGKTDIRRPDSPALRKAGNLRHAFSVTTAEVFVIFDADFCPRSDFLRETVPYLSDNTIGIVQTPQFFSRRDEQTWVEQGAGVCQELFYRMEQVRVPARLVRGARTRHFRALASIDDFCVEKITTCCLELNVDQYG